MELAYNVADLPLTQPVCALPQFGQYEQVLNAVALALLGGWVIYDKLDRAVDRIAEWARQAKPREPLRYPDRTPEILAKVMARAGFVRSQDRAA